MIKKIGVLAIFLLITALPTIVGAEPPVIEVHEPQITGSNIEEAEFEVTVDITGENINLVSLSIQYCSDGMCYMPMVVEMTETTTGQYIGQYSDFEGGYEYYQFQIIVDHDDSQSKRNDYQYIFGLPGYESLTDEDNSSEENGLTDGNKIDNGSSNKETNSPGLSLWAICLSVILITTIFYLKRKKA